MKKVNVFITLISCVLSLVAQEQKVGEITAIENSYRKEMKKERGASLKKTFKALLKTNRYVEHVYYNQDHTEHFSYRIYMADIFNDK